MARDYAVIWSTFWTGDTGRSLRKKPDLQLLALYLMTSPHASMIGAYYLPIPYIVHDIGCPMEGASKGLRRLSEGYFCTYDEAHEWVWVHEMAKFQVGEPLDAKDKRLSAVRTLYEKLPSGLIASGFFARYGSSYGLDEPKPLASPSEGASIPLRSQEQEQEQKKEKEKKEDCAEPLPRSTPSIVFPVVGNGKTWEPDDLFIAKLRETFPNLDVLSEIKKAALWVETHHEKRKTARGMPAFLARWMERAVNSPHPNGNGKPAPAKKELTPEQLEKNRIAHENSRRELDEDLRLQREEIARRKEEQAVLPGVAA